MMDGLRVCLGGKAIGKNPGGKQAGEKQTGGKSLWRRATTNIRRLALMGVGLVGAVLIGVHASPAIAEMSGNLVATGGSWRGASFPVEGFQAYTSPFGYRSSPDGATGQEFHRGLDMAAPEGSYVRNWWAGKVEEVSDGTACGTSVIVASGEWEHIYCHMSGYVASSNGQKYLLDREGGLQIFEGQAVPAGTRIGRVGMTGRTTGPHLHWGLKFSGKWVDPALVLRAMYAEQVQTGGQANGQVNGSNGG